MKNQARQINKLKNILLNTTKTKKHSAYQILPQKLNDFIGDIGVELYPKYEKERLEYIMSKVDVRDKSVLDIGCNTGYFLFELLEQGAVSATGYEGGKYHYEFVKTAANLLNKEERVNIIGNYFTFGETKERYDITILFNVLHHLGDDYGDSTLSMYDAKIVMIKQLNSLSKNTDILVFQMGFNWQGDIKKCLFEHGTKTEMIDFIKQGSMDSWDIVAIGVPQKKGNTIIYQDLNDKNIDRDDSLGEFLNRPIFILRSKIKK